MWQHAVCGFSLQAVTKTTHGAEANVFEKRFPSYRIGSGSGSFGLLLARELGCGTAASRDPRQRRILIIRSYRFFRSRNTGEYLDTWLTPAQHFFVRNHMHEPSTLDASSWQLSIGGEVEKPFTINLAELAKLEAHAIVNTLECAGNGRAFHAPKVPGVQWQRGAVGTGRFSGPRLRELLQRAGVKPSGKHVMFRGLDEVPGKVPPFIRSVPIDKAMDSDTLVATQLNGAPLPKHNGFPARAMVPGWIGAASCKWLTRSKFSTRNSRATSCLPATECPISR